MKHSNILITSYPQTGKSFIPLYALASLRGKKAIAAPTRMLVEQWKARIAFYLPPEAAAEVVLTTYQRLLKLRKEKFTLLVGDEAHHMPADIALDIFLNLQADVRIGLAATPFREDGQADLLPALFGLPVGADWPVSPSQKPAVTVWIVNDDAGKIRKTKDLCAAPVEGKTFVFTHLIRFGEGLAAALDAPLVHGKIKNPRRVIEESDTVVVSRIANEGLSFPVRRVVEAGFWFGSNMEAKQRAGRMGYEIEGVKEAGEHHVLMTAAEYEQYGKRLLVFYQWGLDVQIRVDDSGISLRPSAPATRITSKRELRRHRAKNTPPTNMPTTRSGRY